MNNIGAAAGLTPDETLQRTFFPREPVCCQIQLTFVLLPCNVLGQGGGEQLFGGQGAETAAIFLQAEVMWLELSLGEQELQCMYVHHYVPTSQA